MSLKRKWIPSPNYSSRGGASIRLLVVHTAEGATTIESLGNFFKNPSAQVSSQVGIDDKAGVIGEYVKRGSKAWTQADFNPVADSVELCGFAKWSTSEWKSKHATMLDNLARWLAEESKATGVPLVRLNASQAQGSGRGVCGHVDLGARGGSHHDPGAGFPWSDVIAAAKNYAAGKGGGGSSDYMNPPQWLWDWLRWYLTTSRDPKKRPNGTPDKIPQWAWDYCAEVEKIGKRYGTTSGERDWMGWLAGGKQGPRPDVPETIPERWWTDNEQLALK